MIIHGLKGIKKNPASILKGVATKQKHGIYRNGGLKAWETRKRNGTDRHTEETRRKMSEGAFRMWVRRKQHGSNSISEGKETN
jgi:hypothetical protein